MNARLKVRVLKPRTRALPPPATQAPAHFGSIVRHASARRGSPRRYLLPLLLVGLPALFFGAQALFRFLIFGGT